MVLSAVYSQVNIPTLTVLFLGLYIYIYIYIYILVYITCNNSNSHSLMHSPSHTQSAVHCKAALRQEQFPRHSFLQPQRISALHVVDTSERVLQSGFQPSAVCNQPQLVPSNILLDTRLFSHVKPRLLGWEGSTQETFLSA